MGVRLSGIGGLGGGNFGPQRRDSRIEIGLMFFGRGERGVCRLQLGLQFFDLGQALFDHRRDARLGEQSLVERQ